MPDGSHIYLKKLADDYDSSSRISAMSYVQSRYAHGEIVTGLLYVEPDATPTAVVRSAALVAMGFVPTFIARAAQAGDSLTGTGRPLTVRRASPHEWVVTGHQGAVVFSYTLYADRADLVENGEIIATRPVYAGKALLDVRVATPVKVFSRYRVRTGSAGEAPGTSSQRGRSRPFRSATCRISFSR